MRCVRGAWWALLLAASARALEPVTVIQLRLAHDEEHRLDLNNTVEYILEFISPSDETAARNNVPSLVWLHSDGGDIAHPVLVTARQPAGAVTWQLPYELEGRALFELERTLCPADAARPAADSSDCAGAEAPGALTLHVSTACAAPLRVGVRVSRPPAWHLPFDTSVTVVATQWAPRVLHYAFGPEQRSVRLTASSSSMACGTLSVQNYSCPLRQSPGELAAAGLRLSMLRSGAVQVMRSDFPRGFFVVMLVQPTDEVCSGARQDDQQWAWSSALSLERAHDAGSAPGFKDFTVSVGAALSREQYAVATAATLLLFLGFYVLFGALVLAQRWPPFGRLVLPRAVLAPAAPAARAAGAEGAADAAPARRRRGSNDTFDSCDDSNSDDEEDRVARAPATGTAPAPGTGTATAPGTGTATAPGTGTATAPGAGTATAPGTGTATAPGTGTATAPGTGTAPTLGAGTAPTPDTGIAPAAVTTLAIPPADARGPFGLPARPRLAVLARRPGRTLRARSDRYLHTLYTVAVFYALPVVQFVIAFQIFLNVSGTLDQCYYNFLCAHRAGALSDFNHVISNLGYLLLGALFMLQVRRRRLRRKREPRHPDYGIPAHYGLLSALGAGMMVVAVLSASYHVCPNQLNFQFDTAFMYVLAVLIMVKIYQSRHPDINARAHATFAVLAALIATVVWGVLGGGRVFWGAFTAVHVFTFLLLSLHIYYFGQFRLEKDSLAQAASELRKGARPTYRARLLLLLIGNAFNWLLAIFGLLRQSGDFAGHLLQVLLGNALLYMVFYLAMKLAHGERLRWYAWALLAGAAAAWAPALYFFFSGSSDWSATPALSRHRNHECKVLQFYDNHDLWHLLSAVALYLSFSALLTWDDGLSAVKRTEIPVF